MVLRRYAKAGVLALALVILVGEGYFVYRWYDRYYGYDAASDAATSSAASPEGTTRRFADGTNGPAYPKRVEDTGSETTQDIEDANSDEPADETTFAHTATDENSRGDYTYLSHPSIDGDPNAVVLTVPSPESGGAGGTNYGHNIGVWYDFVDRRRWAIFNQDRAAVPDGATFRVVLP
ncbi:MAG TPA: hypothetical protein VGP38_07260, partial [Rubrobacter sp.]|nr:hypothetical protein [Rubrobacter sp.]